MKGNRACVLCGTELGKEAGRGANPWPVSTSGECCDKCDNLTVMPARLRRLGFDEATAKEIGETNWKITRTFSGLTPDEWFAAVNDPSGKVAEAWGVTFDSDSLKK